MQSMAQHASSTQRFAHPVRNISALGVEPGMSVADFGAGSGAYVLAMAEAMQDVGRILAVDIQRDLLRRIGSEAARRGFKHVELVWADLEAPGATKLADGSLDLVLVSNLLFQVENKRQVLLEAWRVLRPAARLAIIDWQDSFRGMGPQKKNVITKDDALALARECGFDLRREFEPGAHHWGLLLRPTARTAV